jgi:murein peptide amidase A
MVAMSPRSRSRRRRLRPLRSPACRIVAVAVLALAAGSTALTGGVSAATRKPPAHARSARRCLVPGTARTIDQLWRPDMPAAIAYAHSRVGDIAFAARTQDRFYGYRPDHAEWSASVVKAMLLVTFLDLPSVAGRALGPADTSVLGPMISASNNDDAQQIFDTVGQAGLSALAQRVGMTHFATSPVWGETSVTPRDQTRFFLHIDSYVVARHRSYAMRLLRSVIPPERWGIGELAPRGWKLYFKGGWGYGTGLLDHQVALLTRGCARVSLAVLTMYDGSHAYGKATLKGIFARLLRRFPTRFATAASVAVRADVRLVTVGHSVHDRPITARVLGPDSARRKILLVGCIHGNECAGRAVLSAVARLRVRAGVQLWLVPEMNPDGTAADTRQNAHGVDLNRNFPYHWRPISDPTYYSGPRPASEPETRAAMGLIRRIKPALTIWYHQHQDLVDMAGGDRGVARRYAQISGLRATCLPFLPGTAPGWSNHELPGTTSFVVELPAGPVEPAALARHVRAVQAMEGGQRAGPRASCAP